MLEALKQLVALLTMVVKSVKWVLAGGWQRVTTFIAVALLGASGIMVALSSEEARNRVLLQAHPWMAAITSRDRLDFASPTTRLLDKRTAILKARVQKELDGHFVQGSSALAGNEKSATSEHYTAWTAAQNALALTGDTAINVEQKYANKLSDYIRNKDRQLVSCDCWSEISDPSSPQHIGISAWILYTLARLNSAPSLGELSFLRETQDATGGWTMFPMPKVADYAGGLEKPLGSSFATSWALLANVEISKRRLLQETGRQQTIEDLSEHAADFLLHDPHNRDPKTKLWSLYPGWKGSENVSIGTSGLVIFALHRFADNQPGRAKVRYSDELQSADRAFLDAIPDQVPTIDNADSLARLLLYEPVMHETTTSPVSKATASRYDSVSSLTIPWMIIGAADAYSSGSYLQRVRTLEILDSVILKIDRDLDQVLPGSYWMAPEMLTALRYIRDPSFLRD